MDDQPITPTPNQLEGSPSPFQTPMEPTPESFPEVPVGPIINQAPKQKRSKKPLFLSLIVIILLAGVGYGVYAWQHKKVKNQNTQISSLQSQISDLNSQINDLKASASSSSSTQTNPYANWKSYTTKYGVTFKYPTDWVVGTYAGTDGVTVSSVANPVAAERNTQDKQPKYNDNLVLSLFNNSKHSTSASSNSEVLQSNFVMNSSIYCLIGVRNSGISGNPVTDISVNACKSNDKTTWTTAVPLSKGAVEMDISSVGNGGAATVPISLSNSEYATIKLILQSVKF